MMRFQVGDVFASGPEDKGLQIREIGPNRIGCFDYNVRDGENGNLDYTRNGFLSMVNGLWNRDVPYVNRTQQEEQAT